MAVSKSKREQIIERLNRDFSDIMPCKIPLDQPISSHQTRRVGEFGSGGVSWAFVPKFSEHENMTEAQKKTDANAALVGSIYTMTELLKEKHWEIKPDLDFAFLGFLEIDIIYNQ